MAEREVVILLDLIIWRQLNRMQRWEVLNELGIMTKSTIDNYKFNSLSVT